MSKLRLLLTNELTKRSISSLISYVSKTELCTQLIIETNFLPDDAKISERIYVVINNIFCRPKCRVCTNLVNFKSFSCGYREYCSPKCVNLDPLTLDKIKKTSIERYGITNLANTQKARDERKKTCLLKYGVENPSQSESIKFKKKQTCLKNFGVELPAQPALVRHKFRETCLVKYGVDNPSKLDTVKDKKKETCLYNFGVDSPPKSQEIQDKLKFAIFNSKYNRLKNLEKFNIVIPLFTKEGNCTHYKKVLDILRFL